MALSQTWRDLIPQWLRRRPVDASPITPPPYAEPPLAVGDRVRYNRAAEAGFSGLERWPTPRPEHVRTVEDAYEGSRSRQRFVRVSGHPDMWDQRLWLKVDDGGDGA